MTNPLTFSITVIMCILWHNIHVTLVMKWCIWPDFSHKPSINKHSNCSSVEDKIHIYLIIISKIIIEHRPYIVQMNQNLGVSFDRIHHFILVFGVISEVSHLTQKWTPPPPPIQRNRCKTLFSCNVSDSTIIIPYHVDCDNKG